MRYLRVLIVDDDPVFLAKAEAVLSAARYHVATADSFEKGRRAVRQVRGRIVVLSDLSVRGESGIDFLTETLQQYPGLPFTFLASQPALEAVIDALKHGAYDFLRKPVDPEILRHSVARSVEKLNLSVETEKQERDIHDFLAKSRSELKNSRSSSEFKGFLIAMAAHDFRSIFTVLDGYYQLIRERCSGCPSPMPASLLDQVGRTIVRLRTMANTLLDFEAADQGRLKISEAETDIARLIEESVSFFKPYAEQKRVRLSCDGNISDTPVICDPIRIGQVLDNILYNALKFTPAEGEISVGVETRNGGQHVVWIRDTGVGISKEQIGQIFDETRIAEKKDASTRIGMGMIICRKLLEAQNGKIWIESAEGEGTTVYFSLMSSGQSK